MCGVGVNAVRFAPILPKLLMSQGRSNGGRCRQCPCQPAPHPYRGGGNQQLESDNKKPTDRQLADNPPSAPPLGAVGSPCQSGRAAQTPLFRPVWQGLPPAPMPVRPPPRGWAPKYNNRRLPSDAADKRTASDGRRLQGSRKRLNYLCGVGVNAVRFASVSLNDNRRNRARSGRVPRRIRRPPRPGTIAALR